MQSDVGIEEIHGQRKGPNSHGKLIGQSSHSEDKCRFCACLSVIIVGRKGIWLGCVTIVHRIPSLSRVGKDKPDGSMRVTRNRN